MLSRCWQCGRGVTAAATERPLGAYCTEPGPAGALAGPGGEGRPPPAPPATQSVGHAGEGTQRASGRCPGERGLAWGGAEPCVGLERGLALGGRACARCLA